MPFVYCTASNDSIFAVYDKHSEPGRARVIKKSVLVKGGANVATGKGELITKYGVRTEVSDEDLKLLESSVNFQKMKEAGFITVSHHKVHAETAAAEMNKRDESAPLVPEDYTDDDEAKPKPDDEAKSSASKNDDDDEDED